VVSKSCFCLLEEQEWILVLYSGIGCGRVTLEVKIVEFTCEQLVSLASTMNNINVEYIRDVTHISNVLKFWLEIWYLSQVIIDQMLLRRLHELTNTNSCRKRWVHFVFAKPWDFKWRWGISFSWLWSIYPLWLLMLPRFTDINSCRKRCVYFVFDNILNMIIFGKWNLWKTKKKNLFIFFKVNSQWSHSQFSRDPI
jgi:hypothetical protein